LQRPSLGEAVSLYFRYLFDTFRAYLTSPLGGLATSCVCFVFYIALLLNILRFLFDRHLLFALSREGYLSLQPYHLSSSVIFFCILSVIIFCLVQRRLENFPEVPFRFSRMALFNNLAAALLFSSFTHYMTQRASLFESTGLLMPTLWYAFGMYFVISAACIFFNFKLFLTLFKNYRREWIIGILFSLLFVLTVPLIQKLWTPLYPIVGEIVSQALSWHITGVRFVPDELPLNIRDFVTSIEGEDSGLEGISLFLILFTALLIADWKQLIKWRVILFYPIGLGLIMIINVVRIYLIQLIGYQVALYKGVARADQIVAMLYHSYLAWIFYTIIILLLLRLIIPFLIKPKLFSYDESA